jgi:hypothetical protein
MVAHFHGLNDILILARLMRTAKWRRAPSTPPQHAIIAKSLGISLEGKSEEVSPDKEHMRAWCRIHNRRDLKNMTKGAAADMITRLKRGGAKVNIIYNS